EVSRLTSAAQGKFSTSSVKALRSGSSQRYVDASKIDRAKRLAHDPYTERKRDSHIDILLLLHAMAKKFIDSCYNLFMPVLLRFASQEHATEYDRTNYTKLLRLAELLIGRILSSL